MELFVIFAKKNAILDDKKLLNQYDKPFFQIR